MTFFRLVVLAAGAGKEGQLLPQDKGSPHFLHDLLGFAAAR